MGNRLERFTRFIQERRFCNANQVHLPPHCSTYFSFT